MEIDLNLWRNMETSVTNNRMGWSLKELSTSLGLSLGFLRKQVKAGALRAKKLGRRVVVPDSALREYLATETVQGNEQSE
jgi:excisionase family DNA binding protein